MRWYVAVLAFAAALEIESAAHAATISIKPAANGEPSLVTVDGDLQANDGDQFRSKTSFLSKAIISFRSAGGSVVAGIQIGESIRLKGFTTVVAGTARCASACAIAWLGGTPRLMSPQARVGFHAAYSSETGQETGVGNALVGAYLDKIGLPYSAVIYITQAAPNSMTWLSIADAEKQGIDVELLGSGPVDVADAKEPMLVTPADREEARRKALAAIKVDDLVLDDVTLSVLDKSEGHFSLKGIVTNNSKHPLKHIGFEITITDCPNPARSKADHTTKACKTVGQEAVGASLYVPPNQTRVFETLAWDFDGIPEPLLCVENAPETWHHLTGSSAGENEKRAYNDGFVQGRSFFHPRLGFTFAAPQGFVLEDKTDAILGVNDSRDEALRFAVVTVPPQQTFAEYLSSGFIANVDPKSIRYLEINGLPAATAAATGDSWAFRLYVVRLENRVYQFIFSSKAALSERDRAFFDAVSTFRPMGLAEVECPKGRTFSWRITEIEAAGF